MVWEEDTVGWCNIDHDITESTRCPDDLYSEFCRDHCSHYHAAQDAGTNAARCDQYDSIRPLYFTAASRYLEQRYKAEYDAFITAYRGAWRK